MKDNLSSLAKLQEEIYYFNHGNHRRAYEFLGCHPAVHDDQRGYQFSVWAPRAHDVFLQGDFNDWVYQPMTALEGGVWTLFVPEAQAGQCYKYGIDHGNGHIQAKIDPFGFSFEEAPKDATIISDYGQDYEWQDDSWLRSRRRRHLYEHPIQVYEVHATSWRQHPDGTYYSFEELAETLIPYVKEMGYTHIEFMPLMEHPLEASWGYQITGYYAMNHRYGTFEGFKYFVDQAHQAGLGVFLDWVPGHFNRNDYALAYFDGTPTFEYEDTQKADNLGWGTLNFDLGKNQVRSFLISNAIFWMEEFHLDGMRVDAVSNMLYLDFDQGPWTPNIDGTNENYEGVAFLQELNSAVKDELPDVLMMAEESTNWPGVTHPVSEGGLGFDYKWNMGWMNDTLRFFEMDPLFRPANLRLITFAFVYQFNERYILPLSHDEVVHGKDSLLGKMPGDRYNQFANLRLLQGYMMAQPGKKLNFMGNELGQFLEWRFYEELEWVDLERPFNSEYQHYIQTLNQLGQDYKALHQLDHSPQGIDYLDVDDTQEGVMTFIRQGKNARDFIIIICNFVPVERQNYRLGLPYEGTYEVVLNSEMKEFGGAWEENLEDLHSQTIPWNNRDYSTELTVPANSVLYLAPKRVYGVK